MNSNYQEAFEDDDLSTLRSRIGEVKNLPNTRPKFDIIENFKPTVTGNTGNPFNQGQSISPIRPNRSEVSKLPIGSSDTFSGKPLGSKKLTNRTLQTKKKLQVKQITNTRNNVRVTKSEERPVYLVSFLSRKFIFAISSVLLLGLWLLLHLIKLPIMLAHRSLNILIKIVGDLTTSLSNSDKKHDISSFKHR